MTSRQIDLVQETFLPVQAIAADAARLFYGRLFAIDPALRPMFRGDLDEQGKKLMQVLAVGVGALRKPEAILPVLEDLGRRHSAYGVTDEHYTTVGAALLWTLEQGLGAAFTEEVKEAWAAMYSLVASAMQRGARASAAAA
jgi:hemoglobin-like flavoprotein